MRAMTPLYIGLRVKRVQTSDNKEAWGIDRGESALACGEEVPDAPEEDKSTGDGEDGGADGGEPEAWTRSRFPARRMLNGM
jgi:hypothetical protein